MPDTAAPTTADPSGDPMVTIVIAFLAPMFL